MKPRTARQHRVSGQRPDQGAGGRVAHANRTRRQSWPCSAPISPDGSTPIRLHLPRSQKERWLKLPPKLRRKAVAAILVAYAEGVNLHRLGACWVQLHQIALELRVIRLALRTLGALLDLLRINTLLARIDALLTRLETLLGVGGRHE